MALICGLFCFLERRLEGKLIICLREITSNAINIDKTKQPRIIIPKRHFLVLPESTLSLDSYDTDDDIFISSDDILILDLSKLIFFIFLVNKNIKIINYLLLIFLSFLNF